MHVVFTDVEPATTSELILQQKFREAHEKMTSYFQSSIPKYSCISCLQIVSKKASTALQNLRAKVETDEYMKFQQYTSEVGSDVSDSVICKSCLGKFRANQMPALCRLNKLELTPVPEQITELNDTEKHLTQRAKCGQKLTKLVTVSGKGLPSYMRVILKTCCETV